jgi:hypothetical protein
MNFVPRRFQERQQAIEQAALRRFLMSTERARMNAELRQAVCRNARTSEGSHLVPTTNELAHDGSTYRPRTAENQNPHADFLVVRRGLEQQSISGVFLDGLSRIR